MGWNLYVSHFELTQTTVKLVDFGLSHIPCEKMTYYDAGCIFLIYCRLSSRISLLYGAGSPETKAKARSIRC